MIILITGASHTGKTILAQKLLKKYEYPYLSIDLMKMGLIRSGKTNLTPEDDDELTSYMWPIIREMMKTAIENKENLVFEGGYIPYDWKEDFSDEYLNEIRYYCLVMSRNYIEQHFSDIKKYANEIEQRIDDSWWVYPDFCVNSKQRCKTEQNMKGRQRHDRCRLFTNITLIWTDVKGGEAACIPLTSGAGGVTRASGQQRRWPSARGSHTNPGGVRSTFS